MERLEYRRSPVVHYNNGELELDLDHNNSLLVCVLENVKYSNTTFYDEALAEDPIFIFDKDLMQTLAGLGWHAIIADQRMTEIVKEYYPKATLNGVTS